jgi:hypothetical protein
MKKAFRMPECFNFMQRKRKTLLYLDEMHGCASLQVHDTKLYFFAAALFQVVSLPRNLIPKTNPFILSSS